MAFPVDGKLTHRLVMNSLVMFWDTGNVINVVLKYLKRQMAIIQNIYKRYFIWIEKINKDNKKIKYLSRSKNKIWILKYRWINSDLNKYI